MLRPGECNRQLKEFRSLLSPTVKFVPRCFDYTLLLPCVPWELTWGGQATLTEIQECFSAETAMSLTVCLCVGVRVTLSRGPHFSHESPTSSERGFSQPRLRTILSEWAIPSSIGN